MKKNYKLPADAANRELEQWASDADVTSLEREIALLRQQLQVAAASGDRKDVIALASCIGRLTASYEKASVRNSDWLSRANVLALASGNVAVITRHLRAVLPDGVYEDTLAKIADEIEAQIAAARPSRNDIKNFHRLSDMRSGSNDHDFPE